MIAHPTSSLLIAFGSGECSSLMHSLVGEEVHAAYAKPGLRAY
jgi:hypothetical protein